MRRLILLTLAVLAALFPSFSAHAEDEDDDGWTVEGGDCDDDDPAINPIAQETCNGIDEDCDDVVDMGFYAADQDGDKYGNNWWTEYGDVCDMPSGYVADITDCNDEDPAMNPGATEVCNGIDDNCNGWRDDLTFYRDSDRDAYGGVQSTTVQSCTPPEGYVSPDGDCDDSDPAVNPGATEVCDGKDNDCNGVSDDVEDGRCPDPTPTPTPSDETSPDEDDSPGESDETESDDSVSDDTESPDDETSDEEDSEEDGSDADSVTAAGSDGGTLPELPPPTDERFGCSTGGPAAGMRVLGTLLLFLPTFRRRRRD